MECIWWYLQLASHLWVTLPDNITIWYNIMSNSADFFTHCTARLLNSMLHSVLHFMIETFSRHVSPRWMPLMTIFCFGAGGTTIRIWVRIQGHSKPCPAPYTQQDPRVTFKNWAHIPKIDFLLRKYCWTVFYSLFCIALGKLFPGLSASLGSLVHVLPPKQRKVVRDLEKFSLR